MDSKKEPTKAEIRTVIAASAAGTAFEWYDFYIYGTLAPLFGKLFFPGSSPAAGFLLALATFGVGFAVRPLGAAIFGTFGDRFGRKVTFLVTITLMGFATTAIGLLGTFAQWGIAAPILLVVLRALQGLAVGGEYGGAVIYVAEHAPLKKHGFYTGWIQIGATTGFSLSLLVVLISNTLVGEAAWAVWGWRIPFILSLVLLAISLWMRLKLSESPVFAAMQEAGEVARTPLREAYATPKQLRRLLAVTFGGAVGQAICGYTGMIQLLNFMQVSVHMDPVLTRILLIGVLAGLALGNVAAGWLSDFVGRKPVVMAGYIMFLIVLFPGFQLIADQANPAMARAAREHPVLVSGPDCTYNPFAQHGQASACGKLLDTLTRTGVPYTKQDAPAGAAPVVSIGGTPVDPAGLDAALKAAGYSLDPVTPPTGNLVIIVLAMIVVSIPGVLAYGPMGAWLSEQFPARTRYSSLATSYNFGVGIFAGFMPFIVQAIVATTGSVMAGFWYPFAMVVIAALVALFGLPETAGKRMAESEME
ncbi:MAG: MFS transporter [Novosphingobium sp.]|uniref:MFS transporter n=1 Tax=Novosphingobium sp. TaxID=1874826 RepID=UPI0030185194